MAARRSIDAMQEGFAPYAPEVLTDPASSYRHLLEEAPVCWVRSFDPPQHTLFRGLVQQAFTPRGIAAMGSRIGRLSHELLDEVTGREQWDLHDDYAFPLPVIVIAELLGVPETDIHRFKDWSDASVAAMGAADPAPYAADLRGMAAYLLEQIRQRRRQAVPGDDLVSQLVNAREAGRGLSDVDILGVVTQLLVGGNETTTSLITNAVWRLLQKPELWQWFVADPALVDHIVEESLRYDPPGARPVPQYHARRHAARRGDSRR
jgi:cytochrome P450